ncbi:MAG: prepilin-type N-terminal cleavage/methylation domain-containing protein [Cyanobacteriota bacterium]|nr:prepilin-type N-terminal cleavage/methylation domain-containing protein [Cyanobacteriota bacterium]
MPPTIPTPHPARSQEERGFSLPELLVAVALSSLTVVVAVQILGPHLRMNQRMEGYTRLQERWARLAYLLDTEIPKARAISASGNSLSLTVPISTSTGESAIDTITYKQVGTQLLRDGPTITEWGRLDPASQQTNQLVVDGVAANSFLPAASTASVTYSLNLVDPNSDATFNGRGSAARGQADCLSLEADLTPPSCD